MCSRCGRELPLSEFSKRADTKSGVRCYCKSCHKEYYNTHRSESLDNMRKYRKCVKNPACPLVGGYGGKFETFTCEICGKEFRRLKSTVDWNYEHLGSLPRFCSRECYGESRRKTHKSKYEKEIERIKKET